MSYEICVLDPSLAATKEAAFNAWNEGGYVEQSLPDHDVSAPKWRIRQSVSALEPGINWTEPKAPRSGLFAALAGKRESARVSLFAELPAGREGISIYIFDQAVEIDLPWNPEPGETSLIVRELWRLLGSFSQIGMSAIFDTEREVMLDLANDFDAVLKGYEKNVKDDSEEDGDSAPHADRDPVAPPATGSTPFTGNAGDSKPWWKIW